MPTTKPMTKAQRQRKLDQALAHMEKARTALGALCDDYYANAYALTLAERNEWQEAVALHGDVERGLRTHSAVTA